MKWIAVMVAIVLIPVYTYASVRITEVAWMGTTESAYGEWIELYNDADEAVDLKGWKLTTENGATPLFTLTKSIAAHDYLIVERVTASQNPLPDISDEEGSFGGGGLADKGEDLTLINSSGEMIDSLAYVSGWPAGDAKTKDTMQRSGSGWITALPTPKESTGESHTIEDESDDSGEDDNTQSVKKTSPIPPVSPNKSHVEFTFPKIVYRGVPYEFVTEPVLEYNYRVQHGMFVWNMGDGTIIRQYDLVQPWYTYAYTGTYTVSFAYYDKPYDLKPLLTMTKTVQVLDPEIALAVLNDGALRLSNTSSRLVDISDWKIVSSYQTYIIPPMTILAPKAVVTMPTTVLGFAATTPTYIQTPNGAVIARLGGVHLVQKQTVRPSYKSYKSPEQDNATQAIVEPVVGAPKEKSHTKTIVIGIALLFVIALFVLLERTMASKE